MRDEERGPLCSLSTGIGSGKSAMFTLHTGKFLTWVPRSAAYVTTPPCTG